MSHIVQAALTHAISLRLTFNSWSSYPIHLNSGITSEHRLPFRIEFLFRRVSGSEQELFLFLTLNENTMFILPAPKERCCFRLPTYAFTGPQHRRNCFLLAERRVACASPPLVGTWEVKRLTCHLQGFSSGPFLTLATFLMGEKNATYHTMVRNWDNVQSLNFFTGKSESGRDQ